MTREIPKKKKKKSLKHPHPLEFKFTQGIRIHTFETKYQRDSLQNFEDVI